MRLPDFLHLAPGCDVVLFATVANNDRPPDPTDHANTATLRVQENSTCVLRIRYNISTADYDSMGGFAQDSSVFGSANNCGEIITPPPPGSTPAPAPRSGRSSADSAAASAAEPSPCSNVLTAHNRPLYNRPYVCSSKHAMDACKRLQRFL